MFFILYNSVISWGCQNINHYQMSNICVHFPSGSVVKNPPAMQEMLVRFLGWEDPLENEMVTHSNILAWKSPWTEELSMLQSKDHKESGTTVQLNNSNNHIIQQLYLPNRTDKLCSHQNLHKNVYSIHNC